MLNLIGNAIEVTEAGHVSIRMDCVPRGGSGQDMIITVCDTGPGIAPDVQAKLFAPDTQGSAQVAGEYGGAGLGLAICRRLAGLMGGDLKLEGTPGEGSRFTLRVPLTAAPADELPATGGQAPGPPSKPESLPPLDILLVEDSEITATLTRYEGDLQGAAKSLVEQANDKGGKDNISVILARSIKSFRAKQSWYSKVFDWF